MQKDSFVIVIGASAGGQDAIIEIIRQLPVDLPVAVFIVLHLSAKGIGWVLRDKIQQFTPLPCKLAVDQSPIESGHIYIAPPDFHLIVAKEKIKVVNGPHENRWRPSVDVLFRSAAAAYNERVIGIVLTGFLDDGTSGMQAIVGCGGSTIVQDPNEAQYPDMPMSVLNNMEVDYCLPLSQMGKAILDIIRTKEIKGIVVPPQLAAEAAIAEKTASGIDVVSPLGPQSVYSCPDCGGSLWQLKEGNFAHYRCHIGHSYSQADLVSKQIESLESTLWIALRMMEERRNLLAKIADEEVRKGLHGIAETHRVRVTELQHHISQLKNLLFQVKTD
jgi:two-component system chemotaxis response regulator CheB